VARLIRYPRAAVLDFADGGEARRIRALQAALVGQALRTLREQSHRRRRVAAIYRRKEHPARGTTVIEDGDEVFFLAARKDIRW